MAETKRRFTAVLEKDAETSGTGVPIRDVLKLFGTRGGVPVRARSHSCRAPERPDRSTR